jgi:hypothetical protein
MAAPGKMPAARSPSCRQRLGVRGLFRRRQHEGALGAERAELVGGADDGAMAEDHPTGQAGVDEGRDAGTGVRADGVLHGLTIIVMPGSVAPSPREAGRGDSLRSEIDLPGCGKGEEVRH